MYHGRMGIHYRSLVWCLLAVSCLLFGQNCATMPPPVGDEVVPDDNAAPPQDPENTDGDLSEGPGEDPRDDDPADDPGEDDPTDEPQDSGFDLTPQAGVFTPPAGFFGSDVVTIGFDETPQGVAIENRDDIADQYLEFGVRFRPVSENDVLFAAGYGQTTYARDAISLPNTLATESSTGRPTVIVVEFLDSHFSSYPRKLGLVFADGGPNNPFTVTIFDATGTEVDSKTIDTGDNTWASTTQDEDTWIGFEHAGGISRVEVTNTSWCSGMVCNYEIDNLQFSDFSR